MVLQQSGHSVGLVVTDHIYVKQRRGGGFRTSQLVWSLDILHILLDYIHAIGFKEYIVHSKICKFTPNINTSIFLNRDAVLLSNLVIWVLSAVQWI